MRKRLYYILPELDTIKKMVDDLLLQRIEFNHMHVLGPEGVELGDLPRLSILQKTDTLHGIFMGAFFGALIGAAGGVIGHYIVDMAVSGAVVATTLVGAIIGAWGAGLISTTMPNIALKRFRTSLAEGSFLFMVDVPREKITAIDNLIKASYPQAKKGTP